MKPHIQAAAGLFTFLPILFTLSCLGPIGFTDDWEMPETAPAAVTISGIQPETGQPAMSEITPTANYMGTIDWKSGSVSYAAPFNFEAFKDYAAVITLAVKGGRPLPPADTSITVAGALDSAYNAATGEITARFPRTHCPVNDMVELNAVAGAVQTLSIPNDPRSKNIIRLTDAFYTTVNNNTAAPFFISIGASDIDNTVPYTVQGRGKYYNKALNAGILLANNNITLENVRFNITDINRGVPKMWTAASNYRTALLIGRYKAAPVLGDDSNTAGGGAQSKNVTVRNCNINFADNGGMIAGIIIRGAANPVEHISITDNDVSVTTLGSTSAAQALLVYSYAPTLSITGNGLKSFNKLLTHNNPAAALFMQINPSHAAGFTGTPLISGNTINGSPTYDFYINIYSHGDRVGVPQMTANKFATPDSTWMTADSTDMGGGRSFYKKLIDAVMPQTRPGAGYGYLAMYLGSANNSIINDCVFETYARQSGRLYAVDFWGFKINNGAYLQSGGGANEYRARLLLDEDGHVYKKNEEFHWWADGGIDSNINVPLSP
jgi:hypothetical protein